MSNPFIVVRMDSAGSGENYQTVGPWTGGYASFNEADSHAQTLNRRYPRAKFAVFQRRVVYDSFFGTKRSLDRKAERKPARAVG